MYFAGEALNKRDFLLRNLPSDAARKRVIVDFQTTENAPDARAKLGEFDIILGMPGITRDERDADFYCSLPSLRYSATPGC